jgi:hypothetical protein
MKSTRGSEGEYRRLSPREPFQSSTLSVLWRVEPEAQVVCRVEGMLEDFESVSLLRNRRMDYTRFSRYQKSVRRALRDCSACFSNQSMGTARSDLSRDSAAGTSSVISLREKIRSSGSIIDVTVRRCTRVLRIKQLWYAHPFMICASDLEPHRSKSKEEALLRTRLR